MAGIVRYRPADPRPWVTLAFGLLLTDLGDWTWVVLARMGLEPFPSIADALYLGGLALTAVAIIWLLRDRIPGGDRAGLIDAMVVAVGAGLLSWTFVMEPLVSDPVASMGEIAVALAYPVIDILLLGVLVRLFLAPGDRVPALKLILFALVTLLLTDFPYAVVALEGGYYTGHLLDAGWMAASFFWAAAALHPSMRNVAEPVEIGEVQLSPLRLAMLACASLMAPAVLVIQAATGQSVDVVVVATGSSSCSCSSSPASAGSSATSGRTSTRGAPSRRSSSTARCTTRSPGCRTAPSSTTGSGTPSAAGPSRSPSCSWTSTTSRR